jgi:hypothetical protein
MYSNYSRADHFYKAFEDFIKTQFVDKERLQTWGLNLLTQNTRKNTHQYNLNIPAKRVAYFLEKAVVLADGTTEGPGAILLPQERPTIGEFSQIFQDYFSQYYFEKNGKLLSAVQLGETEEKKNGDYIIIINIIYCNQYQPYPICLNKMQLLEKELEDLENDYADLEKDYHELEEACFINTRQLQEESIWHLQQIDSQEERIARLERAFNKLARDAYTREEPRDCPICYETITIEKMHFTLCEHYICADCNSRCNKCPLCRENY